MNFKLKLTHRTLSMVCLMAAMLLPLGAKAFTWVPASYTYEGWTKFSKPSSKNKVSNLISGDDKLKAICTNPYGPSYSYMTYKVNDINCIALDFDSDDKVWVQLPACENGVMVSIEGFCGINDSYSGHKGYLNLHTATYNEAANTFTQGELLVDYAKNGKLVETDESYGINQPYSFTFNDLSDTWVEISGNDMLIKKITVAYYEKDYSDVKYSAVVTSNGEPVANARVDVYGKDFVNHMTTDENGAFSIDQPAAGDYTVKVNHTLEYKEIVSNFTITDSPVHENLELKARENVKTDIFDFSHMHDLDDKSKMDYYRMAMGIELLFDRSSVSAYQVWSTSEDYGKGEGDYGFKAENQSKTDTLMFVRQAKAGQEISFEAQKLQDGPARLQVFKMVRNDDGSYERGELLRDYTDLAKSKTNNKLLTDRWTKVSIDNVEDNGYIGIYMWGVQISEMATFTPIAEEKAYNTQATYNFDYLETNQPFLRTWKELRDGFTFIFPEGTELKEMGGPANMQRIYLKQIDWHFVNKYADGPARLEFEVRSSAKLDKHAISKVWLAVAQFKEHADGTLNFDYLIDTPVYRYCLANGENIADVESEKELQWYTVSVDLPAGGYYAMYGVGMLVRNIKVYYNSEHADLGGVVSEGEKMIEGAKMTLAGPAGSFEAVTGADGAYQFAGVPDGRYTLTAETAARKTSRLVYVENSQADLNVAFEEKPEYYTEEYDDFNWVEKTQISTAMAAPYGGRWYNWHLPQSNVNSYALTFAANYGVKTSGAMSMFNYPGNLEDPEKETIAVTYVKGSKENGGIKLDVACSSGNEYYEDSDYFKNNQNAQLSIYKMTPNEDGTFSRGELLGELVKDQVILATGEKIANDHLFTTIEFEGVTEDCYIGLCGYRIMIDNFVNYYVNTPKYDIEIAVVDAEGNAIENASVALACGEESIELAQAEGKFAASVLSTDVEGKTWTLTASAPYYVAATKEITIEDNYSATIALDYQVSKLTITVKNSEGQAVEGAEVSVAYGDETVTAEEADGAYSCEFLAKDVDGVEMVATVVAYGYADAEKSFKLEGESTEVEIALEHVMRNYAASIVDEDDAPIEAAVLKVTDKEGNPVELTGEKGAYAFSLPLLHVKDAEYTAVATAEGYVDADPITFTLADADVNHKFVLKKVSGITSVDVDQIDFSAAEIYTVSGLRVKASSKADLKAGLYIINGAKVTIK